MYYSGSEKLAEIIEKNKEQIASETLADVVKEVSQEVLFQEATVGDLVEQIYINQSINTTSHSLY